MHPTINITVSGPSASGKTALIEYIHECLQNIGINSEFDQSSLNVVEDRQAGVVNFKPQMVHTILSVKPTVILCEKPAIRAN